MKNILLLSAATLSLAACTTAETAQAPAATAAPIAEAVAPAPKAELGSFGFDATGMDRSVNPGDDFVGFANGAYIRNTEIPADRSSFGMFHKLDDLSRERTRAIIEESSKSNAAPGSEAQKVGDFFASFMDEAAIEAKGAAPLAEDLAPFQNAKTKGEFARAMGDSLKGFGPGLFVFYMNQDAKAPDVYIPYFVQAGLGLPDRDYYLLDNPKYVETRAKYVEHAARMLALTGVPADRAAAKAKNIYEFERQLARVHWSQVESRDDDKTYNKWAKADFARKAPGFDWTAFLEAAGLGAQGEFIVSQPSAFTGMARVFAATPLTTLKDWATLHTAKDAAPVLSKAFVDENFAFNGTVLSGQPEIQPRWKRGVNAVNGAMGEAVGKLYVERHFPADSKAKMDELVRNIIAAMDERLAGLAWMAPETKAKAREKLASFTPKIGYPEKWRDYSSLQVIRGDAHGNAERANAFEYQRNLNKLGTPVDRGEWFMTPMTINAYANPTMNEIVFPAAILQPPFFDPNADPAINYGGIGAVIGHEISHHFDDQGRKYDKDGRLTDWWTPGDVARFKTYTDQVVAQYSAYEPLPGNKVNGELTLGENIGDLAGLTIAYEAYKKSLGGKEAPVIDGFTGDQRFFLGFAQVWRAKYRDPILLQYMASDPHTPGHLRPYVVRNLDAWYEAFDVKPGSKFYLPPDKRVKVW
jgi:putative endopeptidase